MRCVLKFIMDRLNRGVRTYPAGVPERDIGEIFRTDAACNGDSVVLGGWFLRLGHDTKTAPWFQLTIKEETASELWGSSEGSWSAQNRGSAHVCGDAVCGAL